MRDFSRARYRMVDTQIARRGINDPYILQAMRRVPREAFVDPGLEEFAYEDSPVSIGEGQTIERHGTLGEAARKRLQQLGYDNIDLRIGDGTKGGQRPHPSLVGRRPNGAPALKEELTMGGRLVMPVGLDEWSQTLRKHAR